ncbi:hypothetical protein CPB83DRAFT_840981 [Crepidotus variabilis]|uniref:Uncharacterized protein n=1 Tax=Crepidotus variabilis TaxID=179855 RepID=A0A9P6E3E6_9AGAR|nr:hypothetical protein CPB83DRAFT_840981 [Crepidotus variabilis]
MGQKLFSEDRANVSAGMPHASLQARRSGKWSLGDESLSRISLKRGHERIKKVRSEDGGSREVLLLGLRFDTAQPHARDIPVQAACSELQPAKVEAIMTEEKDEISQVPAMTFNLDLNPGLDFVHLFPQEYEGNLINRASAKLGIGSGGVGVLTMGFSAPDDANQAEYEEAETG